MLKVKTLLWQVIIFWKKKKFWNQVYQIYSLKIDKVLLDLFQTSIYTQIPNLLIHTKIRYYGPIILYAKRYTCMHSIQSLNQLSDYSVLRIVLLWLCVISHCFITLVYSQWNRPTYLIRFIKVDFYYGYLNPN